MKIVDLSRELYHRTPSYPGHPPVMHGMWKTHEKSLADSKNVYGLSSMFISMVYHAGTHIDAPRHFGPSGIPINEYPLEKCIVPGICIDLRHIAPRAEITTSDLEAATKKAGVPVDAKVAAILRPIWPDLPMPVTIRRPCAARIISMAATMGCPMGAVILIAQATAAAAVAAPHSCAM